MRGLERSSPSPPPDSRALPLCWCRTFLGTSVCTWARPARAAPLWREGPCSPGATVQEEGCGTAHLRPRVSFSCCIWKPAVTETALPHTKLSYGVFLAGKREDTGIILWISCRNNLTRGSLGSPWPHLQGEHGRRVLPPGAPHRGPQEARDEEDRPRKVGSRPGASGVGGNPGASRAWASVLRLLRNLPFC